MARRFARTAGSLGRALNAALPVAVTRPLRPYPGLRPFEQEEWTIFFGRETMIDEVIDRLAQSRLVLIHGVSGSGKSSLVRAGVLPKLASSTSGTARLGSPAPCGPRVGRSGIWRLNLPRLEGRGGESERIGDIAGRFDARSATLASVAASLEGMRGKSVCVLVDQFEELFRFEKETGRDEAELFVNLITRAGTSGRGDEQAGVDLHVIVTMRSEYLGECARYAGFAETINRTQYLLPRMDDAGLMRAAQGPAVTYGAVFDPALAERLIGSVRGRDDELPLLQHGLALMWDDALRRAGPNSRVTMEGSILEKAGGLAGLLSRHAGEVMAYAAPDVRGRLIVESLFRALTEVNAEGAAIRRPCAFDKLCAVAGATPDELRPIIDAFRAPGVSLLTPYAPEPIDTKTPIDLSHEALIRCWREIGPSPDGWLLKEFRDGVAWRTLLLQAENFAEDKSFFLSETATETRASWLAERNEAWSQRYGGGWPKVVALIEASREHWRRQRDAAIAVAVRQRSRSNRGIAAIIVAAALFGAGIYIEKQREAQQRLRQADVDKSAVRTAKALLEDVLRAYNDRSLDLAGAEGLAAISGQFLNSVRASTNTSAADLLWAQALIVDADLQATLNKDADALALARQAKETATLLTQSNPNAAEPLQALYDAQIRIANALSAMGRSRYPEALQAYNQAVEIAGRLAAMDSGGRGTDDVIDSHVKIGDIYKDLNQFPQALAEYQSGLTTIEAALGKRPDSFDLLRNKAKADYRIAELMRMQGSLDEARAYYQKASEVQSALIARDAQDALAVQKAPDFTLKSNLAATYTHWGMLERKAGNLDLAVEKLKQGVAQDEELAKAEPDNPQWLDYVTPNYYFIAEILEQSGRPQDALIYGSSMMRNRCSPIAGSVRRSRRRSLPTRRNSWGTIPQDSSGSKPIVQPSGPGGVCSTIQTSPIRPPSSLTRS